VAESAEGAAGGAVLSSPRDGNVARLLRVELGSVRRQPLEPEFVPVGGHEGRHDRGPVGVQPVQGHDQGPIRRGGGSGDEIGGVRRTGHMVSAGGCPVS
jgi:hypothetical protein